MSNGRTALSWSVYVHHILCSLFVISPMKKARKDRGQRFHMILLSGRMNVAVVLASSGPPLDRIG